MARVFFNSIIFVHNRNTFSFFSEYALDIVIFKVTNNIKRLIEMQRLLTLSLTSSLSYPISNHLTQGYQKIWKKGEVNSSRPNPGRREKIKLNFCFHVSLWCLKKFYEALKAFILIQLSEMHSMLRFKNKGAYRNFLFCVRTLYLNF